MADLFERLFPDDPEQKKIGVHRFRAVLGDYSRGCTTRAEIVAFWAFDIEAQADLDILLGKIDGFATIEERVDFLVDLHDIMLIAETRRKYATKAEFRARMGL